MTKYSKFFIASKVSTSCLSAVNNGIGTAYLVSRGFSILSISSIFAVSLFVSTSLEYISGNLADKFGRKKIFSLGLIFRAIQTFIFVIANQTAVLYIAAVCEGIYASMVSGSLEAWLKGTEKSGGVKVEYSKVFGLSKGIASIASIVVLFSISILLNLELRYIYIGISVLYLLIASGVLFIYNDNSGEIKKTLDYTLLTLEKFIKKPQFQRITFVLSSTFAFTSIYMLYFQPKALELGLLEKNIPFASAFYLTGGAVASFLFSKYKRTIGNDKFILYSFICIFISYILFLNAKSVLFLLLVNIFYGFSTGSLIPTVFSWTMEIIDQDLVASMISLISSISTIVAAITTLFVGFIIGKTNLEYGMYLGLIITVLSLLIIVKVNSNLNVKIKN